MQAPPPKEQLEQQLAFHATMYSAGPASTHSGDSDVAAMSESQFSASLDALLNEDSNLLDNSENNASLKNDETDMPRCPQQDNVASGVAFPVPIPSTTTTTPSMLQLPPVGNKNASAGASITVPFPNQSSFSLNHQINSLMNGTFSMGAPGVTNSASTASMPFAVAAMGSFAPPPPLPPPPPSSSPPICTLTKKRSYQAFSAISEDENDRERRRQDRNMREQQRSHQITELIAYLRDLLSAAKVPFKPDKYSTLSAVVDYIKELQDRSQVLDDELQKLLDTMRKTTEIINNQYVPASTSDSTGRVASNEVVDGKVTASSSASHSQKQENMFQGLDYRALFESCPLAAAIASIDGRFMDCNSEFESLVGYTRDKLIPCEVVSQPAGAPLPAIPDSVASNSTTDVASKPSIQKNMSLFNILHRIHMERVFMGMSEMLKRPVIGLKEDEDDGQQQASRDSWTGIVNLCKRKELKLRLTVNLIRSSGGTPRFFSCILVQVGSMADEDF